MAVEVASAVPSVIHFSVAQLSFFAAYAYTLVLWLTSEYLHYYRPPQEAAAEESDELEKQSLIKAHNGSTELDSKPSAGKAAHANGSAAGDGDSSKPHNGAAVAHAHRRPASMFELLVSNSMIKCLRFQKDAIFQERTTLRAMAEFGALMVWYFLCDRTDMLGSGGKSYSRDLFVFLFVILTLVAFGSSLQTVKQPVLLVRQQTEEWKGWMQVLFLLYHYFEAKEAYNAIRVFIAGYVWMTGFGNFLYYYKTSDFSIGRFAQMMWRLNFLVFFACVVLRNSYMLYYICPMHTIFTVMVYASLGIAYQLNKSTAWLCVKLALCVASVILLWDIKPVFYAIWKPFTWLVGYIDPRKPADTQDAMHEWFFRSSLDRYVWIYGMLCGMLHPWASSVLVVIDNLAMPKKVAVRSGILAACGVIGYVWYTTVFTLPRFEYNKVHPYTSWIPITLWIIVRNIAPTLRLHHLRLYGWLGCITLETYICQFHVWMRTDVPDGQPKALLVVLPGYPLLNFVIVTAGYVFISHRLFELTNTLKNAAVPHSDNQLLLRNTLLLCAVGGLLYVACYGFSHLFLNELL